MENLIKDLRHGVRVLLGSPLYTVIAVVALALGIGANTAIFSVVNSVLLRPLPYPQPDRLVSLWGVNPTLHLGVDTFPSTGDQFTAYRDQNHNFEHLAAFTASAVNLEGRGNPEKLGMTRVTDGFFATLGVDPIVGRTFQPDEDRPGHNQVVVLSYTLWQTRFGGDRNIAGQPVTLDGKTYIIVGVMPQGFEYPRGTDIPTLFQFPARTQLWAPVGMDAGAATDKANFNYCMIGRLKSGITLQKAQAEMSTIAAGNEQRDPMLYSHFGILLVPMLDQVVGSLKPALLILLGAVVFVLLIACANVANLLLARAAAREKEISIRAALGAGRLRIIRQLLTESIVLSLTGGLFGLLLAFWGVKSLSGLAPDNIPRIADVSMDWRVLLFTVGIALLTGIVFGIVPALQASRVDLNESLKEGTRGSTGRRHLIRDLLVASEIALSLVLLVGAGLMIRSMMKLYDQKLGLDPRNLLTFEVNVPVARYESQDRREALYRQILQEIQSTPGVVSAAEMSDIPLTGNSSIQGFSIEGAPPPKTVDQTPLARHTIITPEGFKTLGIPLLTGRNFDEHDDQKSPAVTVVNQEFVQKFFGGANPLGKRIKLGLANEQSNDPWQTIVGIVGNVKADNLAEESRPQFYSPYLQNRGWNLAFAVRTATDPGSLVSQIRDRVWSVDKDLPLSDVATIDQIIARSVAQRRFNLLLMSIFAVIALLLAAIGIYGVMSYSVTQRTHEIGIRMALGSSRSGVLGIVVGRAMLLAGAGILVGLGAAFALTRLLHSLLFSISATDPLTFVAVALLLGATAFFSSLIPARRATRIDPLIALRYE